MKGKDFKQAKVYKVEFDKIRPLTFDFNTLAELQDLGYVDPYLAIAGLESYNLKAMKALFYAGLLSGQMAEDEDIDLDIKRAKVGQMLGHYMNFDNEHFQSLFKIMGEAIKDFFPEPEAKKESKKEKDSKN